MDVFIVSRLLVLTLLLQGTEQNKEPTDDSVRFGEFCLRIADDSHSTTTVIKPANIVPRRVISGCRCKKENMKQPNETSKVIGSMKWYPSETCSSTEYIETLADGREVCVTPLSLLEYLNALFGLKAFGPDDLTTTEPTLRGGPSFNSNSNRPHCEHCTSFVANWDQMVVQSLVVKMQPLPCHPHIYTNLKNDQFFCWDLFDFEMNLQQMKISLPLEDNTDRAPENPYLLQVVDGCRCREKAKKPPAESSPILSASIWLPSEDCSSTEFIETLMDGREVCVTASSISSYLGALRGKHLLDVKKHGHKHATEEENGVVLHPCKHCRSSRDWTSIHPKDVQSLDMPVPSPDCWVIYIIRLTDGTEFCADSSEPWIGDLMEKLDI